MRAFCGEEVEKSLGRRLDSERVLEFRKRFALFYRNVFNSHDPGLPTAISDGTNLLSLEKRFVIPDICDKQAIYVQPSQTLIEPGSLKVYSQQENRHDLDQYALNDKFLEYQKFHISRNTLTTSNVNFYRKGQNIEKWLSSSDRCIVLGGPGSGKSTLLRYIAIDLLQESPSLPLISQKWGEYFPVWIPFAYWTKLLSGNSQTSLQDLLHSWLKSWDEEHLWEITQQALEDKRLLLLVDGLDEWTNEDALQVAVDRLMVFINQRGVPVIITSRPHGFERIGLQDIGWQIGVLNDFSNDQQKELANNWFLHRSQILNQNFHIAKDEIIRQSEIEADHFLAELQRSPDLQDLAKVPLLLCLLISLHMQKASLPQSRFKAYDLIIDHLVSDHPSKRRKAASLISSTNDLSDDDIKGLLSVLAYYIQCNYGDGLIEHEDAIDPIEKYLQNPSQPFGFNKAEAKRQRRYLLEIGHNTIGLLVKWSQTQIGFFHRIFKEYLTAFYIATLPFDEKRTIVDTNCANPQWREVILSLLHITKTQKEIEDLIRVIWDKSKVVSFSERMTVEYLLYETAFSNLRYSADLAREIGECAFKEVELGFWLPQRERTLDLILDGLRVSKQREFIQTKLEEWFPNRLGAGRNIFYAMVEWPKNKKVIECLWKGLYSEEASWQRSAAQALADIAKGDTEIYDRLITLTDHAWNEQIQAVAIEALLRGWPQDVKISDIVNAIRYSASPILRLMAIEGRVKFKLNNDEDWDELIKLSKRSAELSYYWKEDIFSTLITGWPHSQKTKKACLNSVLGKSLQHDEIDEGVAVNILLKDYPNDDEVLAYCLNEIRNKDYPFLMNYFYGWSLLKDSFRDNKKLIEAIDEWLPKQKYLEPELSFACLVGRTPMAKAHLLNSVISSSIPHWSVQALLEGWGMDDSEVATTLKSLAFESSDKASRIAFLLPQIIQDKAECRKRLLSILRDPLCKRPDFVLNGLWLLNENKDNQDAEVVDAAMHLVDSLDKTKDNEISDINAQLILYYPLDKRVRDIANQEIKKREGCYSVIARSYKDDEGFRDKLMQIACPLPSVLRMKIASRLENSGKEDNFALSLLGLYDYDTNPVVKTQASISYHTLLKNSGIDPTEALETLATDIVSYGPDHEERRQAAFCGLVTLGRLDIMMDIKETIGESIRTRISISDGVNTNISLIVHILKNWDYINDVFKEYIWKAISKHGNDTNFLWKNLCLFADDYSTPRKEAIKFIEDPNTYSNEVTILQFLGRVLPKSEVLLNHCLSSLHLTGRSYSLGDLEIALTSAELLAEHFGGDDDILHALTTKPIVDGNWVAEGALIALCIGWPNCEELERVWKAVKDNKIRLLYPTFFHLLSAKADSSEIFKHLTKALSTPTPLTVWAAPGVAKPIISRLEKDVQLSDLVLGKLNYEISPSEKVTMPRLLCLARGVSPQLRSWCQEELDNQFHTKHPSEIGFDLIIGSFRPVVQSLMSVLWVE